MKKNIKIYTIILLATAMSIPVFSGNKANKRNATLDGVWAFKGQNINGSDFIPNSRSIYKVILNGKYITFGARIGGADITGEGDIEIVSDSILLEKNQKSLNRNMKTNQLTYRLKDDKYLYVKFFIHKNNMGTEIDSWFEEVWEKQGLLIMNKSPFEKK